MRDRRHLNLHVARPHALRSRVTVGVVCRRPRCSDRHVRARRAGVRAALCDGLGAGGVAPQHRQVKRLAQAVPEGWHQENVDERVGDGVERGQQQPDLLDGRVDDIDGDARLTEAVVDDVVADGQGEDDRDCHAGLRHTCVRLVNHARTRYGRRLESPAKRQQYPTESDTTV